MPKYSTESPLERSKKLEAYKRDKGLPTKQDLAILEKHGLVEEVNRRIEMMERYTAAQRTLVSTIAATGWGLNNVVERIADLEMWLIQKGEELQSKGENPIDCPEWMKARDSLMKDLAFAHKHGLEMNKFRAELEQKAKKVGVDDLFEVEAG